MGVFVPIGETLQLPLRAAGEAGVLLYRSVAGGWSSARDSLSRVHARSRQRADLKQLDAHLLRDIGLTREAAYREAQRYFWQA